MILLWWTSLVILFSQLVSLVRGQCTPAVTLTQLNFSPLPVVYDSGAALDTFAGCTTLTNQLICAVGMAVINNGDNGPVNQTLSAVSGVYAWNQDVTVNLAVNTEFRATAMNLFFYNNPLMGIGLPHDIEINRSNHPFVADNSLGHAVFGNQDLSQDDDVRRNITIALFADDPSDNMDYTTISITFRFSNVSDIRWLLLSEIEICDSAVSIPTVNPIPVTSVSNDMIQLRPDIIQTQLNFSCTAETQGSFQWTWSKPGVITNFANANRTSFFTLTPISADSAGTFTCAATYTTASPTGSKNFTIQFQPDAAILEFTVSSNTVTTPINTSVTLSCELYGYLPAGSDPQVIWRTLSSGQIRPTDPLYTITTMNGSKLIQNGGSTPHPSFISSLTIDVVDTSVADTYICTSFAYVKTIVLTVQGAETVKTMGVPTSITSGENVNNRLAILGGVIGTVTMLTFIAVIAIVVSVCARKIYFKSRSNDENLYDLPAADYETPVPQPPRIEHMPSRLKTNENAAYNCIQPFDNMADNPAYDNYYH